MKKRNSKDNSRLMDFCKKWGILPEEIVILSEGETDFNEQEEFDYGNAIEEGEKP